MVILLWKQKGTMQVLFSLSKTDHTAHTLQDIGLKLRQFIAR